MNATGHHYEKCSKTNSGKIAHVFFSCACVCVWKTEPRSEERRNTGEENVTEHMCHKSRRGNYLVEDRYQQDWDRRNGKDNSGRARMETKYSHTGTEMPQQSLSLCMLTLLSNQL